jgi:hypothetical protein
VRNSADGSNSIGPSCVLGRVSEECSDVSRLIDCVLACVGDWGEMIVCLIDVRRTQGWMGWLWLELFGDAVGLSSGLAARTSTIRSHYLHCIRSGPAKGRWVDGGWLVGCGVKVRDADVAKRCDDRKMTCIKARAMSFARLASPSSGAISYIFL